MQNNEREMLLTNSNPTSDGVIHPVMAELGDNYPDNYHGDAHDSGSDQQHRLSPNFINDHHCRQCADEEYNTRHSSCEHRDCH